MTQKSQAIFLDAVVRVDKLHPPGRDVTITGDETSLAALADILKVSTVERFAATATVSPFRGGVRVIGSLQARIVQPSVVTFEPVTQDIEEPIDRIFMPAADKPRNIAPGAEIFVDLEDDIPDELTGPELDLTDLLVETLGLAIDLYPRAPGESLEALDVKVDDTEASPFAGLKALTKQADKG